VEGERKEAMGFIAESNWFLGAAEQGLAADDAIACISSDLLPSD